MEKITKAPAVENANLAALSRIPTRESRDICSALRAAEILSG
jgi:hypothetical protein